MITPAGHSVKTTWQSLIDGSNCAAEIPSHWHDYHNYRSTIWSPLGEIDYSAYGLTRSEQLQKDPFTLIGLLATYEALINAGIEPVLVDKKSNSYILPDLDQSRSGVFIGNSIAGGGTYTDSTANHLLSRIKNETANIFSESEELANLVSALCQVKRFSPFAVSRIMANSVSASIGLKYSLKGINQVIAQACASGTTAIGMAFQAVREQKCDYAICGGTDSYSDEYGINFRGFDLSHTLVKVPSGGVVAEATRPFDEDRSGFLFGEAGAATLLIESEEHLEKRGGEPVAEIVGYGETFDAYSIMAPEPTGKEIERMIHIALMDAGISSEQIDYVNAHGTGTIANDQAEALVIKRVFGEKVAVNSTKSIIGHTLGASGAIEAVVCAMSLKEQELHPSLNLENPILDLDFVTQRRKAKLKYAFSQSFAFGGHNSGIVFKAA